MHFNIENEKQIAPTSMIKSPKHKRTMMLQLFFHLLLVTLTWDQSKSFVIGRSRVFLHTKSSRTTNQKKEFKLSRLHAGPGSTNTSGSSTSNSKSGSSTTSSHHHYQKKPKNGILSRTARESAVIVDWEPVSELQRRIEDGIYYEHFDPLFVNGSEEKAKIRKELKEKCRSNQNYAKDWNNDWWSCCFGRNNDWNVNGNDIHDHVESVFCGFTVTKEEKERLKSASPYDHQSDPPEDESTYQGDSI